MTVAELSKMACNRCSLLRLSSSAAFVFGCQRYVRSNRVRDFEFSRCAHVGRVVVKHELAENTGVEREWNEHQSANSFAL